MLCVTVIIGVVIVGAGLSLFGEACIDEIDYRLKQTKSK